MLGLNKFFGKSSQGFVKNVKERFDKLDHATGATMDAVVTPGGAFAAQFDIVVTRNSSNIVNNLEIAVLGFTEIVSGYNGFISPVTGGTVAVTGSIYNALPDRYRFTHVSGLNTDTIDVTSPTHVYPSLIQSSGFDLYRINNIRYTVSDTALADQQFNNRFEFIRQSIFGPKNTNPISVASMKNPMNNQNNVVDIPISQVFDKETAIVMAMANEAVAATPYEVTLSFFVTFYQKYNAGQMSGKK